VGIQGVIAAQGLQRSVRADAFSIPANHILTLRPDGQYDFESGTSVAAAELTGVIALLMSSTDTRLSTGSIVALLKETGGAEGALSNAANTAGLASGTGSAINVSAALTKLELEQHRGRRVAARSAP
jgi:subtilisin family serine protease